MTIFYSGKPTLAASTALYTDPALTILAPNGYYSVDDISRYQYAGVLQTQATCSPCIDLPYTVLSLIEYSVGISNSIFSFKLSNALPFDIDVKNAVVDIYPTISDCNLLNTPAYQDTCVSKLILASTSGVQTENGSTPPLCTAVQNYYYKMNNPINITVGGTTYNNLSNGDILTVGGWDIFIQLYPECYLLKTDCI
jgi:hypothetical protein